VRLLFVSHSLPPEGREADNLGGMQRVAVDLHDTLAAHGGAEVRTLVLRSAWSERGYRTPLFLAHALRRIRQMARAREIDVVLFSSMLTATLTVPLRRILRRNGVAAAAITPRSRVVMQVAQVGGTRKSKSQPWSACSTLRMKSAA